ncbi:hypothetical protein K9B33_20450 [Sphingobium sp. 3R8]|uniref:hypothetical protein n=1 Tax=Sphingobium sp. 3R8 TaxID=2874921 RepID=UPI001CCFD102|nr:hypothetical protein [Sphingobium sp. 3R8]MBZ9649908.1 hypothetical protein [Sphingobium sp. 3R8]
MSEPASFDDFFAKVDATLAEQKADAAEAEAAAPAKAAFIEQAVKDAAAIAETYKAQLATRGITMQVSTGATGIGVTLVHGNGRKRALHMNKAISGDHLEISSVQPNREKPDFRSTDGVSYRQGNYSDAVFSEKLQKLINDHLFEARHHDGVR